VAGSIVFTSTSGPVPLTDAMVRLTNRRRSASAQRMTLTLCLGGPKNPLRILGPCLASASLRRPVFTSPGVDARLALNLRYPACQVPAITLSADRITCCEL
jgi:hypothetical protein